MVRAYIKIIALVLFISTTASRSILTNDNEYDNNELDKEIYRLKIQDLFNLNNQRNILNDNDINDDADQSIESASDSEEQFSSINNNDDSSAEEVRKKRQLSDTDDADDNSNDLNDSNGTYETKQILQNDKLIDTLNSESDETPENTNKDSDSDE